MPDHDKNNVIDQIRKHADDARSGMSGIYQVGSNERRHKNAIQELAEGLILAANRIEELEAEIRRLRSTSTPRDPHTHTGGMG